MHHAEQSGNGRKGGESDRAHKVRYELMRRPNGVMPWKCYREGEGIWASRRTIILEEVKETTVADLFLPNNVITHNVITVDEFKETAFAEGIKILFSQKTEITSQGHAMCYVACAASKHAVRTTCMSDVEDPWPNRVYSPRRRSEHRSAAPAEKKRIFP